MKRCFRSSFFVLCPMLCSFRATKIVARHFIFTSKTSIDVFDDIQKIVKYLNRRVVVFSDLLDAKLLRFGPIFPRLKMLFYMLKHYS